MCVTEETYTRPPHTHIYHMGIYVYFLHNLKTKPIKPSEFTNFFLYFPHPKNVWACAEFGAHSLRERELYKWSWAVFPGKESSELDILLPRNRTMWTNFLGRSRAPITHPPVSGLYNAPEFWAPHRSTLEASKEKGQVPPKNISPPTALSPLYPPDWILSPSSWTSCIFCSS